MNSGLNRLWFGRVLLAGVMALTASWAVAQDGDEAEPAKTTGTITPRGSAASWSADLPVVSDGRHVWLWADKVDPENVEKRHTALYHADATQRPADGPVWETVTDFTGRLAPHGAAADGDAIWLIFDDGKVSIVALKPAPLEGDWYFGRQTGKSLPERTTVRASVAAHGKLWVLARVETGQAIADLDADEAATQKTVSVDPDDADVMNLVLGLPRELPIDSDDPLGLATPTSENPSAELDASEVDADSPDDAQPADAEPAGTESAEAPVAIGEPNESPESIELDDPAAMEVIAEAIKDNIVLPSAPADRLLVLDRGAWRVVPLPEGWESNRPTQLIAPPEPGASPTLLAWGGKTPAGLQVKLYRPVAERPAAVDPADAADRPVIQPETPRWTATPLTLPAGGGVVGLRVQKQLVLAQHTPRPTGFAAELWAVRGDQLTAIGTVTLDDAVGTPAHGLWTGLPFGDAIGVLAGARDTADAVVQRMDEKPMVGPAPGPAMTAVDLHGQITLEPMRLDVKQKDPLAESADLLIMLGVVVTSTVLLFSFWRRDPTANELRLPEGFAVADLMRRGLAGAIDLTPGLLVATSGFGLMWGEVYERWPGRGLGATWGEMLPGLAAIGITVGHTLVLEVLTGRSLGKWATGLRVMTLDGAAPKPWQAVTRCLLKTFDLIAYLLLVLPVISPNRQRLGDMVAQTVVVMKTPATPDEDPAAGDDS